MIMQSVDTMGILNIKNMMTAILTTKLDKVVRIEMKVWEETFKKNGYGHWYPYEQEARYHGRETYESQESIKSFLYEEFSNNIANVQKCVNPSFKANKARKACAQKNHIGKKTSIGEPRGPWSKKRKNEESTRSQEVMLEKNDTCEGKEIHERREKVEERERISVEHCFLDAIPSLFEKNFKIRGRESEGSFIRNTKRSISFSSNSLPLSIEFSFKELRLFLNAHVSHEDVFGKLFKDSLSYQPSYLIFCILKSSQSYTFLEYLLMLGDATHDTSCDNPLYDSRMNDYYSYVANVDSFVLGVENKEERILGVLESNKKSLEKEILKEETTMSFSLNPSPLYSEFFFKELNLSLESHSFHYVEKFDEDCSDMLSFLDTFVRHHEAFTLVNQLLLHVNEHFEFPCNRHEFLKDDESLETLLSTNNYGFQFFHLYFKESIVVMESEANWGGSFKVLKVHLCGLLKTTFENHAFELNLKELVEKHHDYIISFIEILWKDVFLNDLLVQSKNLCLIVASFF
ncbi:hypothetical protein M9H77_02743 [Catharanthus roseus]|uniref:Uncharacterized protein n=1 Tax=Catharanthus roseus TaxID=4058 RepID=A0ACC0C993_CATRO|nr:hypothetical protein M9H77_02743 [Catharanthus roseus]